MFRVAGYEVRVQLVFRVAGNEARVQLVFPSGLGMRSGYSWCSRVTGYEVRVQLVFLSGLGMRSGYSWCSRVAGYEVRVQLVFPSGLGMRSGYSWCPWSSIAVPSPVAAPLPSRRGSCPSRRRSSLSWHRMGNCCFDLESKFAKSSAADICLYNVEYLVNHWTLCI